MISIASALSCMKCLKHLDLSGNKLSYAGWNALGQVLAACKHLLELHLSGNVIGHNDPVSDLEASPQSPGRGSPVQLNLQSAQVEGMSDSRCLAHVLATFESMFADASPKDLGVFAAGIASSSKLSRFSCSSCGLSTEHIVFICAAACVSTNLRFLGTIMLHSFL